MDDSFTSIIMEIFTLSFEIFKNSLYNILMEEEVINYYLSDEINLLNKVYFNA